MPPTEAHDVLERPAARAAEPSAERSGAPPRPAPAGEPAGDPAGDPAGNPAGHFDAPGVEPSHSPGFATLCPEDLQGFIERARRIERKARHPLSPLLLWLYRFPALRRRTVRAAARLEGGHFFSLTLRDILRRHHEVEVGRFTSLRNWIEKPWFLPPGTRIGNFCSIASGVAIFRREHPTGRISHHPVFFNRKLGLVEADTIEPKQSNPLEVGHDVWIGLNAVILAGCRQIGNGAVIGAGSIVKRDVAPYTVVSGNPARVIWKRFPRDVEERIRESRWWLKPLSELAAGAEYFTQPATPDLIERFSLFSRGL